MNTEENENENEGKVEEATVEKVVPNRNADVEPIFQKIEEIAKEHGIEEAVFIFTLKDSGEPLLYWNQKHFYEAAKLMAHCMRQFKGKMAEDLEC